MPRGLSWLIAGSEWVEGWSGGGTRVRERGEAAAGEPLNSMLEFHL